MCVFYLSNSLMVIVYVLAICGIVQGYCKANSCSAIFLQFLERKLVFLISTYKVFFVGIFNLYSRRMSGIASVCYSWEVILSWTQVLNLVFAKVSPHNFIKVSLLTAYNSIYKFDILCLAETFLNLKTFSNGKNLNVPG